MTNSENLWKNQILTQNAPLHNNRLIIKSKSIHSTTTYKSYVNNQEKKNLRMIENRNRKKNEET